MRNLIVVLAVLVVALFVIGAGCEKKETQAAAQPVVNPGGEKIAVLETTKGVIKFRFFEVDAPNTVANFIKLADMTGANGVVLFNRFYQPDIDLDKLEVVPNVLLSTSMDLRLPLRWTAILYGQVKADLAATSGIYSAEDALKMIMAGSKVTQMLSCLLKNGISHITKILNQMDGWMEEHEYESLNMMRGSMSYVNIADPAQFERANYMKVLHSYK